MIFITGGAFQGKLAFAETLAGGKEANPIVVLGGEVNEETIREADIIADIHLYIRSLMEQGQDVSGAMERLLSEHPQVILTMAEQGCGIVPMDAFARAYRETAGRMGCLLASRAEAVYRVTCGIGQKIK